MNCLGSDSTYLGFVDAIGRLLVLQGRAVIAEAGFCSGNQMKAKEDKVYSLYINTYNFIQARIYSVAQEANISKKVNAIRENVHNIHDHRGTECEGKPMERQPALQTGERGRTLPHGRVHTFRPMIPIVRTKKNTFYNNKHRHGISNENNSLWRRPDALNVRNRFPAPLQ